MINFTLEQMRAQRPCLCGEHEDQEVHFREEFEGGKRMIVRAKLRYYYPR